MKKAVVLAALAMAFVVGGTTTYGMGNSRLAFCDMRGEHVYGHHYNSNHCLADALCNSIGNVAPANTNTTSCTGNQVHRNNCIYPQYPENETVTPDITGGTSETAPSGYDNSAAASSGGTDNTTAPSSDSNQAPSSDGSSYGNGNGNGYGNGYYGGYHHNGGHHGRHH